MIDYGELEKRILAQLQGGFKILEDDVVPSDAKSKHLNPPSIPLAAITWDWAGPEEHRASRLLGRIDVGGLPLHLEAYEITEDTDGVQQFVAYTDEMRDAFTVFGVEGKWQTITLWGREYVLLASPYCD